MDSIFRELPQKIFRLEIYVCHTLLLYNNKKIVI